MWGREAMKALVPELRSLVSARSLPDDVVLRNMRRALSALGDEVSSSSLEDSVGPTASGGEEDVPGSSSTSVVTALAAVELKRETRLWMSMMYKNSSQHRRTIHFQRMRGVTRSLRALSELDVGSAAAALRDCLHAGVSAEAREAALSSPAVAAGAHALWKLPPRALWDDLSLRLRAVARVAAEADDAMLAAAEALVGQLAHTFFMPFALVALAAIARLRAATHQLITDSVAVYNVLAPLLRGGVMPPPGLEPESKDAQPEALVCEWHAVKAAPAAKAVQPRVREIPGSADDTIAIGDDDWSWRVLRPVASSDMIEARERNDTDGAKLVETTTKSFGGNGGEDLGAAVPRRVRGVETFEDRGGNDKSSPEAAATKRQQSNRPSYSRATFTSGLGMAVKPKNDEAKNVETKSSDAAPSFDFASLASGLAPSKSKDSGEVSVKPAGGGKKRRRQKVSVETPVEETPKLLEKKKKAKPDAKPNPKSAVERAMAMLLGD